MSKASALEELSRLRKTGGSRIKSYEVDEKSMYDIVDDDTYQSRYKNEDEFIEVNDGDHSYTRNDGYNDIGGRTEYDSGDEIDVDEVRNNGRGASKRKRGNASGTSNKRKKDLAVVEEEQPEQPKIRSKDIAEMFKQNQKAKPVRILVFLIMIIVLTNIPVQKPVTKIDNSELDDMLTSLGGTASRKTKSSSSFKSRFSSSSSSSIKLEGDPEDLISSLSTRSKPKPIIKEESEVIEEVTKIKTEDIDDDVIPFDNEEEEEDEFIPLVAGNTQKIINKSPKKVDLEPKTPTKKDRPSIKSWSPSPSPTKAQTPTSSRANTPSTPLTPIPIQSNRPIDDDFFDLSDDEFVSAGDTVSSDITSLTKSSINPQDFVEPKENEEDDTILRFFWTDYHDYGHRLGLFGKVKNRNTGQFVSIFVVVNKMQRELYFLPRLKPRGKDFEKAQDDTEPTEENRPKDRKGERYSMEEIHKEITDIFYKNHGVSEIRCRPVTRKYCFELPDVPNETEYLQVYYDYSRNYKQILPPDLQGETFSRVFGTNTNIFEQFVLSTDIMGPCWLELKNPDFDAIKNSSWCQVDVSVELPYHVSVADEKLKLPTPPLTLMSLSIRTIMNKKNNKQEVAVISARVYKDVDHDTTASPKSLPCQLFTYVRPIRGVFPPGFERKLEEEKKKKNKKVSTIRTFNNESALLSQFLSQVERLDPDVIVGHSLENVHLNILTHRLKDLKVSHWSRIGRKKENKWPDRFGVGNDLIQQRGIATGRLLLDISNTYGQSLTMKCDSWTLSEMASLYANEVRLDQPLDANKSEWIASAIGLNQYLMHNEKDTYLQMSIACKTQMLGLSKQLTNIAGNSWARVLTGTRAERNEYILLHEFYRREYILPDKYATARKKPLDHKGTKGKSQSQSQSQNTQTNGTDTSKSQDIQELPASHEAEDEIDDPTGQAVATTTKKKDKYKGGLVFEPEKGLYDKIILVMDFNSLYPSIIQEFNICFTTIDRRDYNFKVINDISTTDEDEESLELPDKLAPMGVFPRLVQSLVQKRRVVKNMMKDPKATPGEKVQWDIKQQALKLTANSMYGCLGYERSRFYARPLAALTTLKGREILMSTKELAESQGLRVIYGDTDSVMINTNVDAYNDALKIGNDFKRQVNQRYKLLEIDIDNVFRRMLLHSKKKYAAVNMSGPNDDGTSLKEIDIEVKGLDMKRREYCVLSKQESKYALNQILGPESAETAIENIHEHLREMSQKVRDNDIPLSHYLIRNRLGKNPKDYPSGGVNLPHVVVAQRLIDRGEVIRAEDVISYVIVTQVVSEETKSEDVDGDVKMKIEEDGEGKKRLHDAEEFNNQHFAKRAMTLKEINDAQGKYRSDVEYYLSRQILPPLERLVAPVSGTDGARIADCLGLDTRKYVQQHHHSSGGSEEINFQLFQTTISDAERFLNIEKYLLECKCGHRFHFNGFLKFHEGAITPEGIECPSCQQKISMTRVNSRLESQIRSEIARYYAGWNICHECRTRTRTIGTYATQCLHITDEGKACGGLISQEYTDLIMYNQLLYYDSIFDGERAKKKAETHMTRQLDAVDKLAKSGKASEKMEELANKAREDYLKVSALAERNKERFRVSREVVDKYMSQNARRFVDMKAIFGGLFGLDE